MLDALIIGSGFSGLGMAVALTRAKKRWLLLEKADGVGGTWRHNRYPGCACDVPSHLYSFSFAHNPDWSHHFAPQKEILQYLEGVAEKEGVLAQCRFGQEVVACTWNDSSASWTVQTRAGDTHEARHLVLGIGGLHHPRFPSVKGRERFQGTQLHSALWDESVDLTGKRVVVVGTGASAIQVVPALAPKVAQLTLFQRTPAWVMPRRDAAISPLMKKAYRAMPWLMSLTRARIYSLLESRAFAFTRAPKLLRAAEWFGRRLIRQQVKDPELQRRLTPDYAAGCKRILLSDEYYPAFNRPNVALESCAVAEVTERGVVTPDGRTVECDAIVWCTGFDVAAPLQSMVVTGRDGKDLGRDAWGHGLHAFRGTTIPGFPNLYMLMGPNTGLGHNSMVYMIESQIQFVLQHLALVEATKSRSVEVKEAAEREFNAQLEARMPNTVWASGCASWYLDEKGRNHLLWPGATWAFRKLTKTVPREAVELRA